MSDALHCVTPNSIQKFYDTSKPSPFSSDKNWSGRRKKPLLLFTESVKFSRSWPLKLDPEALNMMLRMDYMLTLFACILRL